MGEAVAGAASEAWVQPDSGQTALCTFKNDPHVGDYVLEWDSAPCVDTNKSYEEAMVALKAGEEKFLEEQARSAKSECERFAKEHKPLP